jgi:hypothetical protein
MAIEKRSDLRGEIALLQYRFTNKSIAESGAMPRHPRVHAEGLLYHVMARGNEA